VGKVVELSTTDAIFNGGAQHPYTKALLASAPIVDSARRRERIILQGSVPNPANPPSGCTFHPRCPVSLPMCSQVEPKLVDTGDGHLASCHLLQSEVTYSTAPLVPDV
jgi:oligopeptide transport system ATP-binding protein